MFLVRERTRAVGRAREAGAAVPGRFVPCRGTPAGGRTDDRVAVQADTFPSGNGGRPCRVRRRVRGRADSFLHEERARALHHPPRATVAGGDDMGRSEVLDTPRPERVQSASRLRKEGPSRHMGQTDRERQFVAIAVRADGTRVPVRLPHNVEVSLLGRLEVCRPRAYRPHYRLPAGVWGQAEIAPQRRDGRRTTRTLVGNGEGLCYVGQPRQGRAAVMTIENMTGEPAQRGSPWPADGPTASDQRATTRRCPGTAHDGHHGHRDPTAIGPRSSRARLRDT